MTASPFPAGSNLFSSPSPFSLLLAGGALAQETKAPPAKRSEKGNGDENDCNTFSENYDLKFSDMVLKYLKLP